MAEVLDRGVIEIVGDARKLRASIEEAKRAVRTLGDGQKDISRAASQSIDRYIGRLQAQNATINKSVRETELFRLALRGASQEQLKSADAALRFAENQAKTAATVQSLKTGFIALGAIAATALVGAVVAFDQLIKQAGNFQDLAEKTGGTAAGLASLAVSAKVGGVAMEEVASASVKLTKNLTGVDDESEDAGAAIKALGLNLAEFKQLAPEDQLEAVAKALSGFEDGAAKSAVAMALFGKSGAALLPFLKELAGESGRLNILTEEQIALADEYADKQARIQAQIGLHAQAIVTEMLPAYVDLKGAFLDVLKEMVGVKKGADDLANSRAIQDFADNAVKAIAFIVDAVDGLVRIFQLFVVRLGSIAAQAHAISTLQFGLVRGIREEAERQETAIITRTTLGQALDRRIAARKAGVDPDTGEPLTNRTPPQDRPELKFEGKVKKDSSADQFAKAQLQFDLDKIKRASEAQIDAFQNAESVMQALRSAQLIEDREFYASKLGFIRLFAQEQESALQKEIERRQREVFTGKDAAKERLDNERQIAALQAQIEKIRAGATAKATVNDIEHQAAITKVKQAYLDAKAAADAYIESIDRANQREIEGIGRGQQFREQQKGIGAIDDRLLAERRRLEGELRRGQIDDTKFAQYLGVAQETYRREIELYRGRTDAIERAQRDWLTGASEALQNYIDETADIARQTEELFSNAFRGLEDLLTDLSSSGIKSFKDLKDAVTKTATSIVADVNRMLIRQNITGPLAEFLKGSGTGGVSPLERLGSIFTGRPVGGPSQAPAQVIERSAADAIAAQQRFAQDGTEAANASAFAAQISTAGTTFATEVGAAGASVSAEIAAAGAAFVPEITAGGVTLAAELTGAGVAFAAEVTAAGAAFAAAVASASASGGAGDIAGDIIGSLFDGLAEGGPVSGPGTQTSDSIPVMLSNREFVVRATKAAEPGALPFLKTFNERGLAAAVARLRVEPSFASLSPVAASGKAGAVDQAASELVRPRRVIPFARGGIVRSPRTFALDSGDTALVGEAGTEAIMPTRRTPSGVPGVLVAGRPDLALPLTRDIAGNMAVDARAVEHIRETILPSRETIERIRELRVMEASPGWTRTSTLPEGRLFRPWPLTRGAHPLSALSYEARRELYRRPSAEPEPSILPRVPSVPAPLAPALLRPSVSPSDRRDAPERVIRAAAAPAARLAIVQGGHTVERFSRLFERVAQPAARPIVLGGPTIAQRLGVAVSASLLSGALAAAPAMPATARLDSPDHLEQVSAIVRQRPVSVQNQNERKERERVVVSPRIVNATSLADAKEEPRGNLIERIRFTDHESVRRHVEERARTDPLPAAVPLLQLGGGASYPVFANTVGAERILPAAVREDALRRVSMPLSAVPPIGGTTVVERLIDRHSRAVIERIAASAVEVSAPLVGGRAVTERVASLQRARFERPDGRELVTDTLRELERIEHVAPLAAAVARGSAVERLLSIDVSGASKADRPVLPIMSVSAEGAARAVAADAGVPFVGSFESGINFVPQTGLALLHQGEGVLTREENKGGAAQQIAPTIIIQQSFAPGTDRRTTDQAAAAAGAAVQRAMAKNR